MLKHEFGGDWTDEKLDCLREYLPAYARIFRSNLRARYFTTTYVDAFAGMGYRLPTRSQSPNPPLFDLRDKDRESYLKGSARIALEVEPGFHHYLFIDKNPQYVQALEQLKTEFPGRAAQIHIELAEANTYLAQWCAKTDWKKNRAVVFLDPYGMQVDWSLLQTIANTKAIDLWLLFPLRVSVNRLLTRGEPPPVEWGQALTRIFGADTWKAEFYPQQTVLTLFGEEESLCKRTTFDHIERFFVQRLKTIFTEVVEEPLQLYNSKNVPIYLLCFAAGNLRGAPYAIRIARYIIQKKQRG